MKEVEQAACDREGSDYAGTWPATVHFAARRWPIMSASPRSLRSRTHEDPFSRGEEPGSGCPGPFRRRVTLRLLASPAGPASRFPLVSTLLAVTIRSHFINVSRRCVARAPHTLAFPTIARCTCTARLRARRRDIKNPR